MKACAGCSRREATCPNSSSSQVATFPVSVLTEHRIAVADILTIFSVVNARGIVFGWCTFGFCNKVGKNVCTYIHICDF